MAAFVAVAAVPVIGIAGVGIDSARGYMLRQRMSQALDAAALAGGRAMFSATRDADVSKFYFANIPQGFLGATLQAPSVEVSQNSETITLVAHADLPSTFTRVLGVEEMNVQARTVVRRANRGLELVMVLDSTGSMSSNDKIGKLKTAANNLLNILYGSNDTAEKLYVGLVPYTTAVNVGPSRTNWLATGTYNANAFLRVTWRGCVQARPDHDEDTQADVAPTTDASKFSPYFFATTYGETWKNTSGQTVSGDNNWTSSNASYSHSGAGPNKYCIMQPVTPVQPKKSVASAAINAMSADSVGTITNVGLSWGWRMLSPNWRGMWASDTADDPTASQRPLDYSTPGMDKAMIVLTDGLTNMPQPSSNKSNACFTGTGTCKFGAYSAFGRLSEGRLGTTNKAAADAELNQRILDTCSAIKAQNIKLYTIVLDTTDTAVQDLFRACATAPEFYYNSPTADQLSSVFQQIALELSQLRLQE